MASLLDRLSDDMKSAMKDRDQFTLSVIRMLRSEMQYAQIAAGSDKPLTDQDALAILVREQKKRRDAAGEFRQAGRMEAADKLERELEIIARYLPKPLTEEELTVIIQEALDETGAASMSDMGRVMSVVMPKVQGRADGNQVSSLVKEILAKQ